MDPTKRSDSSDPFSAADEHQLRDVIDVMARLNQFRSRGLTTKQMADELRRVHPVVPGGGTWSATSVERVLGLMDHYRPPIETDIASVQDNRRYQQIQPPTAPTLAHRARPMTHHVRPRDLAANDDANNTGIVPLLVGGGLVISGILVFVIVGAFTNGKPTESDRLSAESAAEGPTSAAVESRAEPPPTEHRTDRESDRMTIIIEPSSSADADVEPASARITNDGKVHLEGTFRSDSEAQRFVADAAGIFGDEAIIADYTIDPAAPSPNLRDIALEKPVLFEPDSAVIDPEYIPFLEACGNVLKTNPRIVMSITAMTDSSGDEEMNLSLSQQRADAIVAFYRSIEVAENQLLAVGLGEMNPVADNTTEQGRAQNRRAMLELLNVLGNN